MVKTGQEPSVVYGTEDILTSLCNSVTRVLTVATQCPIHYSGMVQRISKICLKPDIGCFVLFDGGFSGLVVLNFSAQAAMELYETYMLNMGMPKSELASSHTSDEVSNILGELMNQIVGDFTGKVRRELQTTITQNQPKMLHARLPLQNIHRRPQHGGCPLPVACHRHERWRLQQTHHCGGQLVHPVCARPCAPEGFGPTGGP
jgi:CheY-specific phosphatase CheX